LFLKEDKAPVQWDAATQRDAYTWRAMMEMGAVREFLSDTEWGSLDYLLIDLPPGTDKLPNLVDLLPRISGTIIVTIPSDVSQFVVGKSIRMTKELGTPVIGLVENMSAYACTECGHEEALFPGESVEQLAREEGVPYLGSIPFDPRLTSAADRGILFMTQHGDTAMGAAVRRVADRIRESVDGGGQ
jgi:ATP-binding protein involved in chromosome partitioning